MVLAPDRRQALAEWAAARNATIIEDDYDSEFRYDRDPVGALQGLAPDHVALIGTVSKSLSPALRLGWILCPARLLAAVTEEKLRDDRGSPALEQLALATMIESGRFDKHLRRMRAVYAGRRQTLIDAIGEHAPAVVLQGLAAGIHLVARLPDTADELAVAARGSRALRRPLPDEPLSRRWTPARHHSWPSVSARSAKPRSSVASPPSAICSTPAEAPLSLEARGLPALVLQAGIGPQPREAFLAQGVGIDSELVVESVGERPPILQDGAPVLTRSIEEQRAGTEGDDAVIERALHDQRLHEARIG